MVVAVEGKGRRKVAWGVTGAGDQLENTLRVMKDIKAEYADRVEIEVYLSKMGGMVVKMYGIHGELEEAFGKVMVEKNANSPFITGRLQLGVFEFLLLAPATSNTVAKLAHGISDTMLTNGAIQALKAFVPVYVMPVDYREGSTVTVLPNGKELRLRVRKEDAENVRRISAMDGITTFEKPEEIREVFRERFGAA
jgi:archaeoflavoprotein AfpA